MEEAKRQLPKLHSNIVQTSAILKDDADYPERIVIQSFMPEYVTMLGGRMALGRDFLPEEEGVEGDHPRCHSWPGCAITLAARRQTGLPATLSEVR